MKKILSKALSVVVFITMILPSTGTVFAETVGQVTGSIITAKNNAGMPDTLTVTGLVVGDIVKIYSIVELSVTTGADGRIVKTPLVTLERVDLSTPPATSIERTVTQIGTATAKADKATKGSTITTASATVSAEFPVMGGVFEDPLGGVIYVTVKRKGLLESTAQKVPYEKEIRSPLIKVDNVSVENNAGIPDTVTVVGLEVGDIVKVYSESVSGEQVATQTTTKTQTYIFLVTIREQLTNAINQAQIKLNYANICANVGGNGYQLEARTKFQEAINAAGKCYKEADDADLAEGAAAKESAKVKALEAFIEASQAVKVATATKDTATAQSDIDKATNVLNKALSARLTSIAEVSKLFTSPPTSFNELIAESYTKMVDIKNQIQLNDLRNFVAIEKTTTVANLDRLAAIAAEPASAVLSKLAEATSVFEGAFLKAPIGTATAKVDKATKTATATISIPQLYEDEGNIEKTNRKVYVTVTKKGLLESYKVEPQYYVPEAVTIMPSSIVTVVNNALELDTITVKDLKLGDVVTIYEESKKGAVPIGTAIAKADKLAKGEKLAKDAIPTATATLSITLPKPEGGSIYISVTTKAKRESEKSKAVPYGAEGQTNPPSLQLQ